MTKRRDVSGILANRHDDELGALLWRTLDRLERSIQEQRIDPAHAREIVELVSDLSRALPGDDRTIARIAQVRSSWIHLRTEGSRA